jgi:hypothetical protein
MARALGDARRQLHHAAQLGAALGISYLERRADDSHTNLEWLPRHRALASNVVATNGAELRVTIRVPDLSLSLLDDADSVRDSMLLQAQSLDRAVVWLRARLLKAGLDPERFTLKRHYEIPPHEVARGEPFNVKPADLEQLALWFGNAASVLESLRQRTPDASAVRCWPHHFDIATLITVAPERTVGVGLEPGDVYYDEPYWYVNASPPPRLEALQASLKGSGHWHTHEWIGAVLQGSQLEGDATQGAQVAEFLDSAVRACRALVSA